MQSPRRSLRASKGGRISYATENRFPFRAVAQRMEAAVVAIMLAENKSTISKLFPVEAQ